MSRPRPRFVAFSDTVLSFLFGGILLQKLFFILTTKLVYAMYVPDTAYLLLYCISPTVTAGMIWCAYCLSSPDKHFPWFGLVVRYNGLSYLGFIP